jgi:hypothetical protein
MSWPVSTQIWADFGEKIDFLDGRPAGRSRPTIPSGAAPGVMFPAAAPETTVGHHPTCSCMMLEHGILIVNLGGYGMRTYGLKTEI